MKFWLDKGVDGFRMDVIPLISKRPGLPDLTPDELKNAHHVYANGPHMHEYLQEMNRDVMSKYDVMTVGEALGITLAANSAHGRRRPPRAQHDLQLRRRPHQPRRPAMEDLDPPRPQGHLHASRQRSRRARLGHRLPLQPRQPAHRLQLRRRLAASSASPPPSCSRPCSSPCAAHPSSTRATSSA